MDSSQLPASIIQAAMFDPASGTSAPPNFGQEIVPHIHTASGRYGSASHAYLNMDEALRDSRQNAERMRADCGSMECVEQRQRTVALLPWHIEPDDAKNPEQQELAASMTAILEETPRFTEMRRNLQEGIWFGRSCVANQFGADTVRGQWRTVVKRWEPRHGDKLVFRFDDGSRSVDPEQVGIRVSAAYRTNYSQSRLTRSEDRHSKIQPTEMGLVYWFDRWERQTVIVHRHMVEDGPFEDPRMAGRIHGIGIRDRIYWTWHAMVECLQRVVEYLDRPRRGDHGLEARGKSASAPSYETILKELAIVDHLDKPTIELRVQVRYMSSEYKWLAMRVNKMGLPLSATVQIDGYNPQSHPIPLPYDSENPAGIFNCYLQHPASVWHDMPGGVFPG